MSLYQKSNWQSLNTLIAALQCHKIYRMSAEWQQIRQNHRHYYDEYIKLAAIVRTCETSLMYTIPTGIPALRNLLTNQKLHCLSRWDRMEWPARWTQQPGIADWLERELCYTINTRHNNDVHNGHQIQQQHNGSLDNDEASGTPHKQLICLIPVSKMPDNWLNRSVRNVPLEYRPRIVECLAQSLKNELNF
ncbi:unnamed protein product [Medioppia subpectinata]|uniref:Uncharacterized protein n=1 Tax=Medioppia subpectinata TaxID=1979941 RepID=A0A7R9L5W2_9ACAR|nr:unnamed protein product [Medioppia subpectinata]CAG2115909.1 unnamed protein product [Medioppia subpectinata]